MANRAPILPAAPQPCNACPWRVANQGKRHAGSWYGKRNLARLWAGMRRGESMSCHPTDPNMNSPDIAGGGPGTTPDDATAMECAGSLIVKQREFMYLQHDYAADIPTYRAARPKGLTRHGIAALLERLVFGGALGLRMTTPNLNLPDVQYPPLGQWENRSE